MNKKIRKLSKGDVIRVISPSGSLKRGSSVFKIAEDNFKDQVGIKVEYSKNLGKMNAYHSSSAEDRIEDFHAAFKDEHVKAIICLTGGFNANELLNHIDWKILKKNPKPIIGSSDATVLINAIYHKTGMPAYFGPNYFKFGMKVGLEYTLDYFKKCLMSNDSYNISPSKNWSNDKWYKDQDNRVFYKNKGYQVIKDGRAQGIIVAGNLCSLNLLQGSEFMPSLKNSILLIEDDDLAGGDCFGEFDRNLQSLLHLPDAKSIKGVIIGRFPIKSEMNMKKIRYIINSKKELKNIPVIANVDFGHTDPAVTLPIGGRLEMIAKNGRAAIKVINH